MIIRCSLTEGQSLSIGGSGRPPISTTSEASNARVILEDGTLGALQILSTAAQRPDLSMGYRLAQARPGERHAFATQGLGGRTVEDLSPGAGGHVFENLMAKVAAAHTVATGDGDVLDIEAFHWIQGEEDSKQNTPPASYESSLVALRDAFLDALDQVTGADHSGLPWIMSQTASWAYASNGGVPRTGLTQLEIARTVPNFYIVGGQYQLPYIDPQHLTAAGYYRLGELHARAQQALVDGAGWAPFAPVGYTMRPTFIDVHYQVPTGGLQFDTVTVPAQPGMGFSLHGTAAQITSATIPAPDRVRLYVDRQIIESGVQVGYGVSSSIGGVGVGNLCDSETATSVYDGARIANWALHSLDTILPEGDAVYDVTEMYYVGPGGIMFPLDPVVSL